MKNILQLNLAGLSNREKKQVACIARYHRGAFPASRHRVYKKLRKEEQRVVTIISSLLRIADGLDYTHQKVVKKVKIQLDKKKKSVFICLIPRKNCPINVELHRAKTKSKLFEEAFGFSVKLDSNM